MRFRRLMAGSARGAASKPSTLILAFAALTTVYLGIAVFFAVEDAVAFGDARLWASAAAALAVLAAASQVTWSSGVVVVLAVSFVAQLSWAGWIDPRPVGDLEVFWNEALGLARGLADGQIDWALLHASSHPSATAIYGTAAFVFGEDLSTMRVLTAAVWTVQTWLVWRIASEVSELKTRAFACALLFGVSPTLVIFGGLPSVEALFGLFALGAVYTMLSHRRRGLALSAAISGALVALAFLARPTGVGYFLGLLMVLLAGFASAGGWRQRGRMATAFAACLLGFAVGAAPQAALNLAVEGRASIAPGPAIGYQLLIGTDRAGDGVGALASRPDAQAVAPEIAEAPPEVAKALAMRAADLAARDIALDRMADDPFGVLAFAVTDKMSSLWLSQTDRQRLSLSFSAAGRTGDEAGIAFRAVVTSVVGGVNLAFLAAAAAGALRIVLRRGAVVDPTRWVLFYVALLSLAAAHGVGEVRERHHLAFTPLLALLAPLPFARLSAVHGAAVASGGVGGGVGSAPDPTTAPAQSATPTVAADATPQERLAHVLKSMSKPPRSAEEDEGAEVSRANPAPSGDR